MYMTVEGSVTARGRPGGSRPSPCARVFRARPAAGARGRGGCRRVESGFGAASVGPPATCGWVAASDASRISGAASRATRANRTGLNDSPPR